MPLRANYCSQCGGAVEVREIEDRPREVCSSCGKVFYRNPLPVAASVMLNDDREVLLVKRRNEPKKGMWCLPIGFAEINETIAEAALRELREETGIEGKVLRMLDVDSYESDFYGDLLIVTFEMKQVGGDPRPGDDAETISYYPLNWIPKLAFSSNEKALRICAQAHAEEWAIQDSFISLHGDEDRALLSDALVALIQDHAHELTKLWFDEVRNNPTTHSYSKIDPDPLFSRGFTAISQFGRWLKGHEADEEVRVFYRALGRERKSQGFAVHEVMSSLSLLRKHVWTYARSQGMWASPIDVYRALELDRRIALFFDKAVYHMALGFAETAK